MIINELINKTVHDLRIEDEKLILEFAGFDAIIIAVGDCCSHGWIGEPVVAGTLPAVITGWEDNQSMYETVESDDVRYPKEGGDIVAVWPARFTTDKGYIYFNVWNNSNGYYGSSLSLLTRKT